MALQLTNRDPTEHKITISENKMSRELVIKPSVTIDNLCMSGCAMALHGEEYLFEGNETVSIEENLMFLDEPAQNPAGQTK